MGELRVVTFKAEAGLVEAMNRASRMLGLTRSELIREAVLHYLDRLGVEVRKEAGQLARGDGQVITIMLEG
ncbi:ribbon-helix-helix protein, CopG family [Stetteria hydrogenophila]